MRCMDAPRLRITGRLRSIMSYDKLAGEAPRILILRSQYWLDGACEAAARALGWQAVAIPMPMEGSQSREQIAQFLDALVHLRPDFILSINLAGMDVAGMWARFFDDLRVPYVAWFVDNPRTIIMDRKTYASPHAIALTWDDAYADYLRRAGFAKAYWLPLAADATMFNAEPSDTPVHPPAFVGNSMVEYAERAWGPVRKQSPLNRIATSAFERGAVTRENIGKGLDAVIGDARVELDAEQRRHLEMLFFLEGTRRLRHTAMQSLAADGAQAHGDDGWAGVLANARPAIHYFNALPAFYRDCTVNLNFTSIQMPSAVNQRVFDCPAAGGFLLTDRQGDLRRLFSEDEVADFATIEECREKLRFYREHPRARREIVERARRRILAEHTYTHRLRTIARWIMETFG